jgi:hypothetical protein
LEQRELFSYLSEEEYKKLIALKNQMNAPEKLQKLLAFWGFPSCLQIKLRLAETIFKNDEDDAEERLDYYKKDYYYDNEPNLSTEITNIIENRLGIVRGSAALIADDVIKLLRDKMFKNFSGAENEKEKQ